MKKILTFIAISTPILSLAEEENPFADFPSGGEPHVPQVVLDISNLPEDKPFGDHLELSETQEAQLLATLISHKKELRTYLEANNWALSENHINEAVNLYNDLLVSSTPTAMRRGLPEAISSALEEVDSQFDVDYEKSLSFDKLEKLYKICNILSYIDKVRLGVFLDRVGARGEVESLDYFLYIYSPEHLLDNTLDQAQYGLPHLNTWTNKNSINNPLFRLLGLERITPVLATAEAKITFLEPYLSETDPILLIELIEQYVAIGNAEAKAKLLVVAQNATTLGHADIATLATAESTKIE